MKRWAIARGADDIHDVAQYLPSNYQVVHEDENGMGWLICGVDNAGWTLDEYVIPRLGSGLIQCREVWPVFTNSGETGPEFSMDVPKEWTRGVMRDE